jgi:hypothetical protein
MNAKTPDEGSKETLPEGIFFPMGGIHRGLSD